MPDALLERAAAGTLPAWTVAGPARRAHMGRVAELMEGWASSLRLEPAERIRWTAAGWLHDALRDEDPEVLRAGLPPTLRDLPGPIVHGPAAAERLRIGGVVDGELLRAVAYHTLGHAAFGRLGRALYAADFLEPGRTLLDGWRAELRDRMPGELDAVVREILGARIVHLVGRGVRIHPETAAFWNGMAKGA